jgi:glutaredoxin
MNIRLTSILIASLLCCCLMPSNSLAETATSNDQQIAMLAKKSRPVMLYGRPGCSRTQRLAQQLSENGISFIFKNVDSAAESNEMFSLVRSADPDTGDSVSLPVVLVNKQWLMINPSIDELVYIYKHKK